MLPAAVSQYLETHRQEHLQKLMELLRFESIANLSSPDSVGDGCHQAADWLVETLRSLGMQADVYPTAGRPSVIGSLHVGHELPTLLTYGHFDVQPPEPMDPWQSKPFEPEIKDDCVYARGASDDKGQLFAHIMALEAWQQAGGGCPVNITFLFEGEEEIGSPNLEPLLREQKDRLSADAAVISDGGFFAEGLPSITYGLRGLLYLQLELTGPSHDVHSGQHGGLVANPINALAKMISAMHDDNGRVTIPGFYDDVLAVSEEEKQQWAALPFDESEYAASLGLDQLAGGEKSLGLFERRWARPTLDCNGIIGGHTGKGSKTVIPAKASAKITTRLVPRQDPKKIAEGFRQFVADNTPAGTKASIKCSAEARPVLLDKNSAVVHVAKEAFRIGFAREPVFMRCGATVPVTELIQRVLGLDAAVMGFGLPDDNVHGPNERFRLQQLWRASITAAALMQLVGGKIQKRN